MMFPVQTSLGPVTLAHVSVVSTPTLHFLPVTVYLLGITLEKSSVGMSRRSCKNYQTTAAREE